MGALFGGSKAPQQEIQKPYDPPATPTIDDARQRIEESDRMRKKRGRFANMLSGSSPLDSNTDATNAAKKTLG